MKRFLCLLMIVALAASLLVACGDKKPAESVSSQQEPAVEATPEPTPEPPYEANPLTGEPKGADYVDGRRMTAVMVNNIVAARPQRGLSAADMLFEIKVEGGITRFMALYNNYEDIKEVGPIRSARDQFFRLVLTWQPLYIHDGQSVVQAQYITDYDYSEWNVNDAAKGYRDKSRVNWCGQSYSNGLAIEHTEYTNAENIQKVIDEKSIDMKKNYNSTFFNFVDYRHETERPITDGEDASFVSVTHSQSYKTRFIYDQASKKYEMQQYYYPDKSWRTTVDENNNQALNFTNLIVLFTDIYTYPGHEAKDLQYAEYSWGGYGYYIYGGKAQPIYWQKGTPLEPLMLYQVTGDKKCDYEHPLTVNMGKCYVTVVDLDEYDNFYFADKEGENTTVSTNKPVISAPVKEVELEDNEGVGVQSTTGAPSAAPAPEQTQPQEPEQDEEPEEVEIGGSSEPEQVEQSAPEASEAPASEESESSENA